MVGSFWKPRRAARNATTAALLALATFAAACDAGDDTGDDAGDAAEVVEAAAVVERPVPGVVTVRITDSRMELSQDSVPAGTTSFRVVNAGGKAHGFRLKGTGIELGNIAPGGTAEVPIPLQPGVYQIVSIGGDPMAPVEEENLRGRLVVVP